MKHYYNPLRAMIKKANKEYKRRKNKYDKSTNSRNRK